MTMNIDNLKKELFQYTVKTQREYTENRTISKYRAKYLIVFKIYHDINALNDEKSIRAYVQDLIVMSKNIQKEYNLLFEKYSKETNPERKSKLVTDLNECAFKLNAYNETSNIINKHLALNKSFTEVKPTIRENATPVETKKENKPLLQNDDTILSDKIISLLEQYNELDRNTTEAQKIAEEVYRLRVERENKFKELYGIHYRVFISELESFENMISILPSEPFKTRELDSGNFILELRTAINAINEYHFINELQIKKYYKKDNSLSDGLSEVRYFKKYNNFLRKYHVLISSLFGSREVLFKVDDDTISSEDLISYLGTCNLDGDFSVYKKKFSGSSIGVEEATKKKYIDTLTFLNKCIRSLCSLAESRIKDGKIDFIDKETVKSDIIKKRNTRLNEIYYLKESGKLDSGEFTYERK